MKKLTIEIHGDCTDSLCNAIREVAHMVGEGYICGCGGNLTDDYNFSITETDD